MLVLVLRHLSQNTLVLESNTKHKNSIPSGKRYNLQSDQTSLPNKLCELKNPYRRVIPQDIIFEGSCKTHVWNVRTDTALSYMKTRNIIATKFDTMIFCKVCNSIAIHDLPFK